ncbi:MAG: hypothetical protein PHR14_07355 [Oscillospiraceae bacterium]|nr:hypothetical protein [Oscillospiraceae bacterium]
MGYVEGNNRDQAMIVSYDELVEDESIVRLIDRFVEVCDLRDKGTVHLFIF